jgi:hypothetical protein
MRKPSAALVVASAALVMATIGTSVAASGFTITSSKQIKPGSISLQSLSKSARKALRGNQGPPGDDGQDGQDGDDGQDGQDGQDGLDASGLWAQIGGNAAVNAAGGDVTARAMGTGIYLVNFGEDITHCAVVATQASLPNFNAAGQSTAGITGPAYVAMSNTGVDLAAGFPSQTSVRVQTNRANGSAVASNFTVAAFC